MMDTQSASIKKQILGLVGNDLAAIETELEANLTPWLDLVRDTAGHILFAGGKRLRPLLLITCARICGSDTPLHRRFSTIFEYLHAATLLHDDLVDGAKLRRGKPAAQHIFGNETAVLTGDFLLARSLSIAADTNSLEVIRIIGNITEQMSQGEIEQLQNKGRLDLSEGEYLETIRRKTAVLMEGACHVGALVAQATPPEAEALKRYGHLIGMAFQMADDLLDYTSDTTGLGKAVGADLREGKLTLPVIVSLEAAPPEDRGWMTDMIQSETFTDADFERFSNLLEKHGGIDRTRKSAATYVSEAKTCLEIFPPSSHKTLLELIATYALLRKA
jgi:octaprenyl-diphosphate synthase